MTKVVAPLGSFSASGKIGKALVFFSHLGRNVVRGLVTPANPQTETQGDSRLLLGAIGRSAKAVVSASPALPTGSNWYVDANPLTPAGQTWVSYLIRNIISIYGSGNTGVAALNSAASGHTKAAIFTSQAAAVGLVDLTISYAAAGDTTITAGAQLYALARHSMAMKGANPASFARAPYTTALASWSSANIVAFVADIQEYA